MGQFDRVAFKQSGEGLFDSLFKFDRQLKDTMAYANTQKNGSLEERLQIDKLGPEISLHKDESGANKTANIENPYIEISGKIQVNITDDVDDESLYRKRSNRQASA